MLASAAHVPHTPLLTGSGSVAIQCWTSRHWAFRSAARRVTATPVIHTAFHGAQQDGLTQRSMSARGQSSLRNAYHRRTHAVSRGCAVRQCSTSQGCARHGSTGRIIALQARARHTRSLAGREVWLRLSRPALTGQRLAQLVIAGPHIARRCYTHRISHGVRQSGIAIQSTPRRIRPCPVFARHC